MNVREKLAHGQQRLDLGRTEPQTGQCVAGPAPPPIRMRRALQAVPAPAPIPHDGRVQSIAKIFEVALEGRARDAELFEKNLRRHHAAFAQQGIDTIETFRSIHLGMGCTPRSKFRKEARIRTCPPPESATVRPVEQPLRHRRRPERHVGQPRNDLVQVEATIEPVAVK